MTSLNTYTAITRETAIYPPEQALMYLALGLCGESGEVAEKIKKQYRDGKLDVEALIKELGDVLWYWTRLCDELNVDPEAVINLNIRKLLDRKNRGVIQGSGDNR